MKSFQNFPLLSLHFPFLWQWLRFYYGIIGLIFYPKPWLPLMNRHQLSKILLNTRIHDWILLQIPKFMFSKHFPSAKTLRFDEKKKFSHGDSNNTSGNIQACFLFLSYNCVLHAKTKHMELAIFFLWAL